METIRNNTSFSSQMTDFFMTVEEDSAFRKHQQYIISYFEKYPARGMLLFHKMGFGKSLLAVSICNVLKQDIVFISAKTLHHNFEDTIQKYVTMTKKSFDCKVSYVSLNASNMMEQVIKTSLTEFETVLNKNIKTRGSLQGKTVVIDEAHNFFNSVVNGSGNATKLYKALLKSDCRILLLTGSPVVNDPFETVVCFNILSGSVLFPEDYREFKNAFVSNGIIKNAHKYSNRISGLVSYYAGDGKNDDMPKELPIKVMNAVMSKFQYGLYFQERKLESEAALKKKKTRELPMQKVKAGNASFRVMTRQISNFAYPEYATEKTRNERGKLIINGLFEKLTQDDVGKNINMYSPKMELLIKTATEHVGIGIIYSQFINYGLNILEMLLKFYGYTKHPEVTKKTYAVISGEVPKEEVDEILRVANSKKNCQGDMIKILLISSTGAEGVDFKNIRHIHILEPYWHISRILQVIGRGVRFKSHADLAPEERTVSPFIYISQHGIKNNNELTTDEYLYNKSMTNQKLINSFYETMQNAAIDCKIHGGKNCRVCGPTNKKLFELDVLVDLNYPDPCPSQVSANIFTFEGETYAEYIQDGETYFAKLNPETGQYEKVSEDVRERLLSR